VVEILRYIKFYLIRAFLYDIKYVYNLSNENKAVTILEKDHELW